MGQKPGVKMRCKPPRGPLFPALTRARDHRPVRPPAPRSLPGAEPGGRWRRLNYGPGAKLGGRGHKKPRRTTRPPRFRVARLRAVGLGVRVCRRCNLNPPGRRFSADRDFCPRTKIDARTRCVGRSQRLRGANQGSKMLKNGVQLAGPATRILSIGEHCCAPSCSLRGTLCALQAISTRTQLYRTR